MLEMLADYDIHPRAVLWYQGEAEGYEDSAQTYLERFAASYRHILNIDTHRPWTDGAVRGLVERIAPDYLVHELCAHDRASRAAAVRRQNLALGS